MNIFTGGASRWNMDILLVGLDFYRCNVNFKKYLELYFGYFWFVGECKRYPLFPTTSINSVSK